jgi:2C-methyl-D-erythritol 2,4-cyclodiphosphate synthase
MLQTENSLCRDKENFQILDIGSDRISIKATTTEKLGFVGEGRHIRWLLQQL